MKQTTIKISILIIVIIVAILILKIPRTAMAPGSSQSSTNHEPLTTLFFGGDIMLSRNVAGKMYDAKDFTLPFKNIKDQTASADIAFANLESPFSDKGQHFVDGSLVFNADPQSIAGLTSAGFDVLSTANNHALDQGPYGLDFTINLLKQNGIMPVGTFNSNQTLSDPAQAVITKNKTAFGFLSYSYTGLNDGGKSISPLVADFNDLGKLKQNILEMRGHYADVVIVNMHAGTEYTRTPIQKQIDFAHAAIDAGADLVIGEHPHWVQTVEQYKGKWIFYSLGNLVFDQMWSTETTQGLTLLVIYNKTKIQKIILQPVIIEDYSTPRWTNSDETQAILSAIGLTSPILFNNN